jgi:hypothetical protein
VEIIGTGNFFVLSRLARTLNTRKAGLLEHRYEPVNFALRDAAVSTFT